MDDAFDVEKFAEWLKEPIDVSEGQREILFPDELNVLCEALRVTETVDAAQHGEYWSVFAHSFADENGDRFSIVLRIQPRSDQTDTSIEGLRVALRSDEGIYYLATDVTDHRGQVWFRDLPAGCYCAIPDRRQLYGRADSSSTTYSRAAAASIQEDLLSLYASDRRVRVDLERSDEGGAVLTISTDAGDLANAEVQYGVGETQGTLTLASGRVPGLWEASRRLDLKFSEMAGCVPQIRVVSKSTGRMEGPSGR
jgi:hypothetical protein